MAEGDLAGSHAIPIKWAGNSGGGRGPLCISVCTARESHLERSKATNNGFGMSVL